jgi:hypothetical protein
MTYIAAADFRTPTLAEYCLDIPLTTQDADDTRLGSVIAREQARLEELTNDLYTPQTLTFDMNGWGRPSLPLFQRCTAVTTVKTRDLNGTLTTQDSSVYRLVSSLDAAGAVRVRQYDRLAIVPGKYIAQVPYWSPQYVWPWGDATVQVVGTFGWTVTPPEIKRALALMVWQHTKPLATVLRQATQFTTADAIYTLAALPPEAQDIIIRYTRPEVPFA